MNELDEQVSLYDRGTSCGKTLEAHSAARPPAVPKGRTSASSWKKSSGLKTIPYMSLDLTPGSGNLLGEFYWEMISPLPGGSSTLNTGPAPLSGEDVSTLSQILEDSPHRKYYLSKTACLGILRRAEERGKALPPQLRTALMMQAGLTECTAEKMREIRQQSIAFAANQRDEVRDLHDVASALGAQPGMKQQTFIAQDCLTLWDTQQSRIFAPEGTTPTLTSADGNGGRNPGGLVFTAGFCAGAGPTAGSIGYQEEIAPTLKASASGNMMPSILCLNDQGGSVMECSEEVAGTLRAQEHGHQPLVFENHGIAARYRGPLSVAPTLSARIGTGGNNAPLAIQDTVTYARQRTDKFQDSSIASTESARQHKDATDLVCQPVHQETECPLLIRRLSPLECERLQGYPDFWTDLPGASDSVRYKSLGNSVAMPCVEYVMQGIALALRAEA